MTPLVAGAVTAMALAWALAVACADLADRRIPDLLPATALAAAALSHAWFGAGPLGIDGATALAGGAIGLAVTLPSRFAGWLGLGDVKMAVVMGVLLGPWGLGVALLAGAVVQGVVAAVVWLRRGTGHRVATAPALAAGFSVVLGLRWALA